MDGPVFARRTRTSVADLPTGPKEPHSAVLSADEEAIIVAFGRHTLLAPDDCLYALQPTIPHLSRSSVHRCLQRHGISFNAAGGEIRRVPEGYGENRPSRRRRPLKGNGPSRGPAP